MMNAFGVSGNLMSLGALDFGLIVDGAVIIVEAVMHQLSHSKKFKVVNRLQQKQMDEEVRKSASKMMNSAVFGQVIILVVYLPILTLQGIEGKMFKPMAQTVAFALLGAFLLSLTYIPMLSSLFLSKNIKHKKESFRPCDGKSGTCVSVCTKQSFKISKNRFDSCDFFICNRHIYFHHFRGRIYSGIGRRRFWSGIRECLPEVT